MQDIFVIVRILLLVVSFYGYFQLFHKKTGIKVEFAFLLVFSAIGSVMYLAGILNILKETAVLILLFGILCAVWSVKQRVPVKDIVTPGTVFFGVMSIFFLFLLRGSEYIHYDNFSHWAVIVKVMLENNRLPNFQDSVISFQSYPPGSACFIYYIVKIAGIRAEWAAMYAQVIYILGAVTALFAFVKKKNIIGMFVAVITAVFLMSGNTRFFDLLVDTLLPVVGLGGMAFCIYYKESITRKIWVLIPILVMLCAIKNSGIFFVVIVAIYYLLCMEKNSRGIKGLAGVVAFPFLSNFLWKKHVELVFENGLSSKHTMSLQNYKDGLGIKSGEDIRNIASLMGDRVFSFSNQALYGLLFVILLLILVRIFQKNKFADMCKLSLIAIGSYIFYQVGTLAMYLFSMPDGEALKLASYDRYHNTILIFVAGILCLMVIMITNEMHELKRTHIYQAATGILCVAALCIFVKPQFSYYMRQQIEGTQRVKFDEIVQNYEFPEQASYLILCKNNRDYLYYLSGYLLNTTSVKVCDEKHLDEIGEEWRNYEFLIVLEDTPKIQKYVKNNFQVTEQKVIHLLALMAVN